VPVVAQAHNTKHCCHRTFAWRKDGTCQQHLHVPPDASGKDWRESRDDDMVASGMTVRYVSDQLEYIIFNFTDQNLHGNPQDLAFIYDTTV